MSSFDEDEQKRLAEKLYHEHSKDISDKDSYMRAGKSFFEGATDGKGLTPKRERFLKDTWPIYTENFNLAIGGEVSHKQNYTFVRSKVPRKARPLNYVGYDKKKHKTVMVYREKYLRLGKEVIRYRGVDGRQYQLYDKVIAQRKAHARHMRRLKSKP